MQLIDYEYNHEKLVIAVDFDGTIIESDWPFEGDLIEGAKETINELVEDGHIIIIWTCRDGEALKTAINLLDDNDIKYHKVNENIKEFGGDSRKIYADLYLDDKSQVNTNKYNWNHAKRLTIQTLKIKKKKFKYSDEEFFWNILHDKKMDQVKNKRKFINDVISVIKVMNKFDISYEKEKINIVWRKNGKQTTIQYK